MCSPKPAMHNSSEIFFMAWTHRVITWEVVPYLMALTIEFFLFPVQRRLFTFQSEERSLIEFRGPIRLGRQGERLKGSAMES
jgi:hypothetical protein